MREYAIIGAGGFANEVKAHMGDMSIKCFVEDGYYKQNEENIFPLSSFEADKYQVVIAIGDSSVRCRIAKSLPADTMYFTFVHPSVQILGSVQIGEGTIICANTILTTNIKIGKHAHLNLSTTIGHDCVIGDFFTTAPSVAISGHCKIGDRVYFGTNSCIREKVFVCDDVTIGMMSAVVKDIRSSGTYVGIPSKLLER